MTCHPRLQLVCVGAPAHGTGGISEVYRVICTRENLCSAAILVEGCYVAGSFGCLNRHLCISVQITLCSWPPAFFASMPKDSDSLAGLLASSKPIRLGAGPTRKEGAAEVQTEEVVARTEQSTGHTDEQLQQVHRDIVAAQTQIGTEMNASTTTNSA